MWASFQTQEGHKNAVKISMRCLSDRRLPQLTAWAGLFCSVLLLHVVYIGIYEIMLKWRQSSSHASGFIHHYQSARNLARSIGKPVSGDALVVLKKKTVELAQIKKAHAELADELRWSVVELQRLEPLEDVVFFSSVSLACSVVLIVTSLVGAILLETYGPPARMEGA